MISMAEIERETRKSEQEIRKLKMAEMMSETHEKKVIRSSAIVQEFEDVLEGVLIRPVSEIIYGLKNAGREFE